MCVLHIHLAADQPAIELAEPVVVIEMLVWVIVGLVGMALQARHQDVQIDHDGQDPKCVDVLHSFSFHLV